MTCAANHAAVACGKKFESGHQNHLCLDCQNIGTLVCTRDCFFGIECRFEPSVMVGRAK